MGFFGSLFGEKVPAESASRGLVDCASAEERKAWFARAQAWHAVPAWLVENVVAQLPGHPPTMLALFVDAAVKARLIPKLEALRRVEPPSVSCAEISGRFLEVGGPLAQDLLQRKTFKASDERAALARDCLKVALSLYPDPPSASPLLALLLGRMNQLEEANKVAEDGLRRVEDAVAEAELGAPDDDIGEMEELRHEKSSLEQLAAVFSAGLDAKAAADSDGSTVREARNAPAASGGSRVFVEYSKDEGKRGPDWMRNNVDPTLGLYFTPQPKDPAWKQITAENVAAYQLWFQRALLDGKLHQAFSSDQIVGDRAEAVCKAAFDGQEKHGLNAVIILVLAHQYIEADQMMRGLHTVEWVAHMVKRDACAPSPEAMAPFVIDFYGLQRAK